MRIINLKDPKSFFRRFLRNRGCVFGGLLVFTFVILALFAPLIVAYPPNLQNLPRKLELPSLDYILGTDILGRDLFSRIAYGAQLSIIIAVFSVLLALLIAIPLGLVSGFFGGKIDQVIMGSVDILLAFPSVLLALVLIAILGTGLENLILAVGINSTPIFTRLIRSTTMSIKEEEYVLAAKAIGENDLNVIFRYIFPNVFPVIVVQATLRMGVAILIASGLGFLGLGVQPPTPEWGTMVGDSRIFIGIAPHTVLIPGLAILLFTLGFNFLGDGLNDVLNPRLKE